MVGRSYVGLYGTKRCLFPAHVTVYERAFASCMQNVSIRLYFLSISREATRATLASSSRDLHCYEPYLSTKIITLNRFEHLTVRAGCDTQAHEHIVMVIRGGRH